MKTSIRALKAQINPDVRSYVLRTNPKPIRAKGSQWIPRKFRVFLTQASSAIANFDDITIASVTAAGLSSGTKFRILRYAVWNTTNANGSTGYVEAYHIPGSSGYSGMAPLEISDTGTASSLPGVGMEIPRSLSIPITGSTSSATVLLSVRSGRSGITVLSGASQNLVVDVEGEIAV